ncbi:unnamed protein product, partial [Owenia fusiformis]
NRYSEIMAERVSELLDSLPSSVDVIGSLHEIKTILNSLHPSTLKEIVPNVSFNTVFDCINSSESEVIEASSDVLQQLLQALEPLVVLTQFQTELILGMSHSNVKVRKLCLKQILCVAENDGSDLVPCEDVLIQVVRCLGDETLEVALLAAKILTTLGQNSAGVKVLFSGVILEELTSVMEKSDIIRYRVFEMVVNVASSSNKALTFASQAGFLNQLVNEIQKDDILIQLNCIELLKDLALHSHGLAYLEQQGVVTKLEIMMSQCDENPLMGFLLPGLIKFFGNVARIHPNEICDQFKAFTNTLFGLVTSPDQSLKGIAIETVGVIGERPEGKLALEKMSNQMDNAVKVIGGAIKSSPEEVRSRAIESASNLMALKLEDHTMELLAITENWFNRLIPKPLELLLEIVQQPLLELRVPTLTIISHLAVQPWGQTMLNNQPGFNEYILNRSTENTKEGKELKFLIAKNLIDSPSVPEIFGRPYLLRLREYHREGPFYVRAQAEVATEEDS